VKKKYSLLTQTHHMTELLESVDWDEEKLSELMSYVEEVLSAAHLLDDSVTDKIEKKFGSKAKKAIQDIVNNELYNMNLHTKGVKNVH